MSTNDPVAQLQALSERFDRLAEHGYRVASLMQARLF